MTTPLTNTRKGRIEIAVLLVLCGVYHTVWGLAAVSSAIMLKDLTLKVHSDLGLQPVNFIIPSLVVFSVAGLCFASVCLHLLNHRIAKKFIAATLLLILVVKTYDLAVTFEIGFGTYDWLDPCIVVIVVSRTFYLLWRQSRLAKGQG